MQAGRRDEDGYQEEDPPQEADDQEQDGEIAHGPHGPKIVGGHLQTLAQIIL